MFDVFGRFLKLRVHGTSHARTLRFAMVNFPKGFTIDDEELKSFMNRRAPGRDNLSTMRRESDEVNFISGVKDGVTDGEAIVGLIANNDIRPQDYGVDRTIPRPGHADFGQWVEMGVIPTGGGNNSGRMTAVLCAVGGICKQWLAKRGIEVHSSVDSIGHSETSVAMIKEIETVRSEGDSIGGSIVTSITGMPPGIGGALTAGVECELSELLFAIPGMKGVEFGAGFDCTKMRGSQFNDEFYVNKGKLSILRNQQGGIMGGRTNGNPITFRVAMRPTPTIYNNQHSVDLATMKPAMLAMKGRHDPCIVRRAVPVVEAIAALVMTDLLLVNEAKHPRICLTLTGKTIAEDIAQFNSQCYFTDMVEVRVDLLKPTERNRVDELKSLLPKYVQTILTYRRKVDGGAYVGAESKRVAFFKKHLKGFDYVDFEDDFRDAALMALADKFGVRIIRSLHCFDGPIHKVTMVARKLVKGTNEIAKIAMMPKQLSDVARIFRETANFTEVPHVICAMGPLGSSTRILAGRTHSLWTYTSVNGSLSDLGHFTPQELVRTYRFRSVSRTARLFGVTGFPLKATRSPEIHNAAYLREDMDAVMIPFPSTSAREALSFMKAMGMSGLAVTIPHKRKIIPLLDKVTAFAKSVDAVNTVSLKRGKYVGYNTDVMGFTEAIEAFVWREGKNLSKLRVAVLGDGGAAQAVKVALKSRKVFFKVFHRKTPNHDFDLLVNATPVDPIPNYRFTGKELVYDLAYLPVITPLIARAKIAGCATENGFSMLQAQAREQRRIWIV